MSDQNLFGKGGQDDSAKESSFEHDTVPARLDIDDLKKDIEQHIELKNNSILLAEKTPTPVNDNSGDDNDISFEQLKKQQMRDDYILSELEKKDKISEKRQFNLIIKVVIICFCAILAVGFVALVAVIAYTSIKKGDMTETGVINQILNFVVEIVKAVLNL